MRLNLKNARRLEQSMERVISEKFSEMSTGINVSIYAADTRTEIISACGTTVPLIDQILALGNARYIIRGLIGTRNETSGLNALMIKERILNDGLHALVTLKRNAKVVKESDRDIMVNKLAALKEKQATDSYGRDSYTVAYAVSEEEYAMYLGQIKETKKHLDVVADECATINLTETIQLPDEMIELLNDQDLI